MRATFAAERTPDVAEPVIGPRFARTRWRGPVGADPLAHPGYGRLLAYPADAGAST